LISAGTWADKKPWVDKETKMKTIATKAAIGQSVVAFSPHSALKFALFALGLGVAAMVSAQPRFD